MWRLDAPLAGVTCDSTNTVSVNAVRLNLLLVMPLVGRKATLAQ